MKNKASFQLFYSIFLLLINYTICFGQNDFNTLNSIKGYRLKKVGTDIEVYINKSDNTPDFSNLRKMNSRVYFRYVNQPKIINGGITYVLITIPGKQNSAALRPAPDPRNGLSIDSNEYDFNFWVNEDDLKEIQPEYYKIKNDFISGVLTAPFKLRLKTPAVKESYVDGSFNVGGFFGGKMSFGTQKPTYVSLIGLLEMTSISYNSSNNSQITDSKNIQSGFGFTYGFGVIFRIADISPGFVIGWDHGFGDMATSYLYHDHPWISFSLNFDFIKPKPQKKDDGNK